MILWLPDSGAFGNVISSLDLKCLKGNGWLNVHDPRENLISSDETPTESHRRIRMT